MEKDKNPADTPASGSKSDTDISPYLERLNQKYGLEMDKPVPDDLVDLINRLRALKESKGRSSS